MPTSEPSSEPLPESAPEAARDEEKFEEETLPGYIAEHYYPAHIGEVLHDRYRIVCKLGYGVYSTVWLCKDTQYAYSYASMYARIWRLTICRTGTYVAIKMLVMSSLYSGPAQREVAAYLHLEQFRADKPHSKFVRNVREHACLVHEPLGIKASDLQKRFPRQRYPSHILRMFASYMLSALAFLHEAGVVHAGKYMTLCRMLYLIFHQISMPATFSWASEISMRFTKWKKRRLVNRVSSRLMKMASSSSIDLVQCPGRKAWVHRFFLTSARHASSTARTPRTSSPSNSARLKLSLNIRGTKGSTCGTLGAWCVSICVRDD
jgi:hypothetical protein